jgi:Fic family protein
MVHAQFETIHEGLTQFRDGSIEGWIERFAVAPTQAAGLAETYLDAVTVQMERWREMLAAGAAPRADAAAWAAIDVLPAHPMIAAPVAAAATGRAKSAIHQAIQQLERCGVLVPVSTSKRNRLWEAAGLLELLEGLEAGRHPPTAR